MMKPVDIEGILVTPFAGADALIARIIEYTNGTEQRVVAHLNVHGANVAHQNPLFKQFLNQADDVFCDGAGIVLGAKLLGAHLPCRMTSADWIMTALRQFCRAGKTVYFLGGKPGVSAEFVDVVSNRLYLHSIVGDFHGYLANDPIAEQAVIDDINAKAPDILFVGMGMPVQEAWIAKHRANLKAKVILPIGALMDYYTGQLSRCPDCVGEVGLEWLYRLCVEPRRLFKRYVVGNPAFLTRILWHKLSRSVLGLGILPKTANPKLES